MERLLKNLVSYCWFYCHSIWLTKCRLNLHSCSPLLVCVQLSDGSFSLLPIPRSPLQGNSVPPCDTGRLLLSCLLEFKYSDHKHPLLSFVKSELPTIQWNLYAPVSPPSVWYSVLVHFYPHSPWPPSFFGNILLYNERKSEHAHIPHATSCGGYNVFYSSVSQSVSPSVLFFLSGQLLWNRSTEFQETLYLWMP